MADFLLGHLVEQFRRGWVVLAQALGDVAVDAAVLLLVGNGERQDFLFGKVAKSLHVRLRRSIRAPASHGPTPRASRGAKIHHIWNDSKQQGRSVLTIGSRPATPWP